MKNLDINQIKRLYFDKGLSLAEVGKRLGGSAKIIRHRILAAGWECRSPQASRRKFTDADATEMKRLYCEEGLSSAEIAGQFDCSDVAVRAHLEKQGVRLRTAKEAQALRRKKETERKKPAEPLLVGGNSDSRHIPKEQVTPERILQLRNEENLTINAIAERCSLSNLEVYKILQELEE